MGSVSLTVAQARTAWERGGLFGLLRALNHPTPYRYTGIYRFEGPWVKNIWLFDREHPHIEYGSDIHWDASYCRLTAGNGDACEITNAPVDIRLERHPSRQTVQCYVGVLLKDRRGHDLGTLCHFDLCPHPTPEHALPTLRAVRDFVEHALSTELTTRGELS